MKFPTSTMVSIPLYWLDIGNNWYPRLDTVLAIGGVCFYIFSRMIWNIDIVEELDASLRGQRFKTLLPTLILSVFIKSPSNLYYYNSDSIH